MLTLVKLQLSFLFTPPPQNKEKIRKVRLREGDHLAVIVMAKQTGLGENEFTVISQL